MRIGVPKEVKEKEYRVAITPAGVQALTDAGHTVLVESGAGIESGFSDEEYLRAGARLVTREEAWGADMVLKVKEPVPEEYRYFRENLLLFTYLHLAAHRDLTEALLESGVTAVGYETVQLDTGELPLLAPMSEIAGRMSVQVGAQCLEKARGGRGVLLGGVPGVPPARVVVIGGGNVGMQAARIAAGMGADVTVLDIDPRRLRQLDDRFGGRIKTLMSNRYHVQEAVREADLVIGAVLIPGARAPKIVSREMVASMQKGSVIVDVAVDQGGCVETADRVTTHEHPTYEVEGVIHYAVANIPGAVPRTATLALTHATLPYVLRLASEGLEAIRNDPVLRRGLNIARGCVTCPGVAEAFQKPYVPPEKVLGKVTA